MPLATYGNIFKIIYRNMVTGNKDLASATSSYYQIASKTAAGGQPDCNFFSAFPTAMVDPVVDWLRDINDWTVEEDTLKFFDKARFSCPDGEGLHGEYRIPVCGSEARGWLKNQNVSKDELED
jgi:hypothetical protein